MNTLKKMLVLLVTCVLCIGAVYADGDGNIEGGGGDMGGGTNHGSWTPGAEGVRVSIVSIEERSVVKIADFSNAAWQLDPHLETMRHFGTVSKLGYQRGVRLELLSKNYKYSPLDGMPTIISSGGKNNIEEIRFFFTQSDTIVYIADTVGMEYDDLVSGAYKLLLEPMAYFTYEGVYYGMTATEAALFDVITGNQLRYWMGALTHQNQPLSMFLEQQDKDLGLMAWYGTETGYQSNAKIINFLGMGVISFSPPAPPQPPPTGEDHLFRVDTDVIVAIEFHNDRGDITPDDDAYIDLNIGAERFRKQFVCPSGESQLVWVQWHTPDTPQQISIKATCDSIPNLNQTSTADIVELLEVIPPDPRFEDSNPEYKEPKLREFGLCTSTQWGEWTSYWVHDPSTHTRKVWRETECTSTCPEDCAEEHGYWDTKRWTCSKSSCDKPRSHGHWEFEYTNYEAKLMVEEFEINPSPQVPTAYRSGGQWVMGSGYGINVECKTRTKRSTGAQVYDVTAAQNIVTLYPEFDYQTYNRLMQADQVTELRDTWMLKPNQCSIFKENNHFTPLWYPDDADYTVQAVILDAWTPGGMLYTTVSDSMLIFMSAIDDWYIHIVEE